MLDRKEIATPMASNLKLLCDASSESLDAMMYHHMIGSLMYLTNTIPNICFAVNTMSQFLMDLRQVHLIAVNHVVRYLIVIVEYGLRYDTNHKTSMYGYVDLDWSCTSTK